MSKYAKETCIGFELSSLQKRSRTYRRETETRTTRKQIVPTGNRKRETGVRKSLVLAFKDAAFAVGGKHQETRSVDDPQSCPALPQT